MHCGKSTDLRGPYGCHDAGTHLYRVGTEAPRVLTTSRAGTPLASSFLAALTLVSFICRLRPPMRPSWRATSSPARVRSTINSLHLSQACHHVEEKAPRWHSSVDCVGKTPELDTLLLKLADEVNRVLNAAAESVQLPNYKVSPARRLFRA